MSPVTDQGNGLLKMFVWKDILCDYTCGMAVALAKDEAEARRVLVDRKFAQEWDRDALSLAIEKPADMVFDTPAGVHVWGGG